MFDRLRITSRVPPRTKPITYLPVSPSGSDSSGRNLRNPLSGRGGGGGRRYGVWMYLSPGLQGLP
jgi:hypothetical protein